MQAVCLAVLLCGLLGTRSAAAHGAQQASASSLNHRCIHDDLLATLPDGAHGATAVQQYRNRSEDVARGLRGGSHGRQLSETAPFEPLRIAVDYSLLAEDPLRCSAVGDVVRLTGGGSYSCTAADVLSRDGELSLRSVLDLAAFPWLSAALSVQRVVGRLQLARGWSCGDDGGDYVCCDGQLPTTVQAEHDGGVSDADVLIFVTARPTVGNTLAWAITCQRDQWGRPIAAQLNFGAGAALPSPSSLERRQLEAVALHELMHALGMSSSSFSQFRASDSSRSLLPSSSVLASWQSEPLGRTVSALVTPLVRAWVRNHFGCDELRGAELEDSGGSGSAGSHWERRLFFDDFMTASKAAVPVLSGLTLALLADSGWYQADLSIADKLAWGAGQGCGFAQQRCSTWPAAYRCQQADSRACSYDARAKAICALATYTADLPASQQYFTSQPRLAGIDAFMDYCPVWRTINAAGGASGDASGSRVDCRGAAFDGPASAQGSSGAAAFLLEELGEEVAPDAACFEGDYGSVAAGRRLATQTCHRFQCLPTMDDDGNAVVTLSVLLGEQALLCPRGGGSLQLSGAWAGHIICPDEALLCGLLTSGGASSAGAGNSSAAVGSSSCVDACSGAGSCVDGSCVCFPGRAGATCAEQACSACVNGGICNGASGRCDCPAGFYGADCSQLAPLSCPPPSSSRDGNNTDANANASSSSAACFGHGSCDEQLGICLCQSGWLAAACEQEMPPAGVLPTLLTEDVALQASVDAVDGFVYFVLRSSSNDQDIRLSAGSAASERNCSFSLAASFFTNTPSMYADGLRRHTWRSVDGELLLCGSSGSCASMHSSDAFPIAGLLYVTVSTNSDSACSSFTLLARRPALVAADNDEGGDKQAGRDELSFFPLPPLFVPIVLSIAASVVLALLCYLGRRAYVMRSGRVYSLVDGR